VGTAQRAAVPRAVSEGDGPRTPGTQSEELPPHLDGLGSPSDVLPGVFYEGLAMARPTKLTPERIEGITAAVRGGAYAEVAARANGISPSTYYQWMARGERGEPEFQEFSEAVREAEAVAEVNACACLEAAWSNGDWRAAIKYLERRYPKRWAERSRIREWESQERAVDAPGAELAIDPEMRRISHELVTRAAAVREQQHRRREESAGGVDPEREHG
jgi:hypothetical protein